MPRGHRAEVNGGQLPRPVAPRPAGQRGFGSNNYSTLRALAGGGGIKLEKLVLLESTERCEVCCDPGHRHLPLFVRDCMKIIRGEKWSRKGGW